MFSKNTYFLPQVSQSVVGFNGGTHEILFHNPDMVSGHYNLPLNASTFFHQDVNELINVVPNSATVNTFQRKQTAKKDRHSKIHTAQGARDRRVRLSIGIARKFFDLQEMLGFDKPSRTLDWLLTKSKAAIKELAASGNKTKSRISSPSECEVVSAENASSDSKGKGKDPCQLASNLAKESRAKARARARERTREKMCIKQLDVSRKTTFDQIPYRVNNTSTGNTTMHPAIFEFQQNLFVSRDFSSNYNIPSVNPSDNWDICAILDQHKFINGASNI